MTLVRCLLGLLLGGVAAPGFAQLTPTPKEIHEPDPAPVTPADFAMAAFKAAEHGPAEGLDAAEYRRWEDRRYEDMALLGLAFYDTYPKDPRRWLVVQRLLSTLPLYDGTIRRPGTPTPVRNVSEAAKAAWLRVAPLRAVLLASADAPDKLKEEIDWSPIFRHYVLADRDEAHGEIQDIPRMFEAHLARYGKLENIERRVREYVVLIERAEPGSSRQLWSRLLDSPAAAVRTLAREQLEAMEQTGRPVDIAFTAADGRKIDLKDLRGKVVLIDFWATWCGPCIAELPNLKSVYTAYHDRGFEVIGITLENARLVPNDTPGQTAAKLAAAKKVLMDFVAKAELPWPQHFDGKWWKNDFAVRYGIGAVPAMFLLDQDGKIVSTNARGDPLEREVRRLLKLL